MTDSQVLYGLTLIVAVICVLVTILAILVVVALWRLAQIEAHLDQADPDDGLPVVPVVAPQLRLVAGGRTRGADA